MAIPVNIVSENGHFRASLLGMPVVSAEGPTRESALAALQGQVADRQREGTLAWMNAPLSASDIAGTFRDRQEVWDEMMEEVETDRVAQRKAKAT